MRSDNHTPSFEVQAPLVKLAPAAANGNSRFDRLARRLRRAGLVWAQNEPGHLRWSTAGDYLTSLVADSPWIRRQVNDACTRWADGAEVQAEEAVPGCWILPSGTRTRGDGLARGLALVVTRQAAGSRGSLRALCQSANLDHDLIRDLLLAEPAPAANEIPRLASMVRLLRPVALRQARVPAIEALLRAVETTHRAVRGHSERTARLAEHLAGAAGMTPTERETVRVAGLLHDVGKLGIPDRVLSKPGRLDEEERAVVNMHPEIGHRLLQGVGGLEHTLPAVLWHHERWDGQGYPHRLSGERIPRIARLMAIVDSFDAMRSDRPYRGALEPARALAEIREGAGRQFDPALANTFLGMIDREPSLAA